MGSSWIFSAQASPSYEGSEPSWAELGQIFELKTSWTFSLIYSFFCFNFLFSPHKLVILRRNSITFSLFCCKWYCFFLKMTNFKDEKRKLDLKKIYIKFSSWKKSSRWREKGHEPSRAENTSARAMARASLARTHHYYLVNRCWSTEFCSVLMNS